MLWIPQDVYLLHFNVNIVLLGQTVEPCTDVTLSLFASENVKHTNLDAAGFVRWQRREKKLLFERNRGQRTLSL